MPFSPTGSGESFTPNIGGYSDKKLTDLNDAEVDVLIDSITKMEGGNPGDRNTRNNNPGNLEASDWVKSQPGYVGTDGRFAIFDTPEAGEAALENLLVSGDTIYKDNTVGDFLETYAPQHENDTAGYTNFVEDALHDAFIDDVLTNTDSYLPPTSTGPTQAELDAQAAADAAAAEAEYQAQLDAAEAERVAAEEANRQAEIRAAEQRAAAQRSIREAEEAAAAETARLQAEADARIAALEAESEAQLQSAVDRLASGEIDFSQYLIESGLQDTYNESLGISVGGATPTDTGYVAGDGPVHTTTGQHTVENEMDGATAVDNWKAANNNNDDGPHMTHDEIIAHHKSLQQAETDLIQSDLSDDDFWDAYEDDGGSDDGGGSSGGGGGWSYGCYVATALNDAGYWNERKKLRLISWCMKAKPEGSLDTKLWRNGYCWFGKEIIAPRVDNSIIRWLSEGFYQSTVHNKRTLKSLLGKAFFYIPSYSVGVWKLITGKLVEIERT